ncbi:MAG TPA: J domain-containing protein [Polyangiaceae bacterium]
MATVFVSDPTAEAERVAQALRGAGYIVVDVPLSMLVARVAVQHPRVILVDADGDGALEVVSRMRELPSAEDIDVLFVARPGGAVASPEEAMAQEGSGLFVRPVDIPALVRKVEALTGGAGSADDEHATTSTPPPSIPTSSKKRSSVPPPVVPSLPPASMRVASVPVGLPELKVVAPTGRAPAIPARRSSEPPPSGSGSSRRVPGLAPPVSPELMQLLADAEQRATSGEEGESIVPSPEDEIEAVLPAELLAALDEPLEADDDEDEMAVPARSLRSSSRERTNDGGGSRTTGATGTTSTPNTPTTGNTPRAVQARVESREAFTPPPHHTQGGTHSGSTGASESTTGASEPKPRTDLPASPPLEHAPAPGAGHSVAPPTAWSPAEGDGRSLNVASGAEPSADPSFPSVLGPGDAMSVLARATSGRRSTTLCFAAPEAERRVVLREGDVVTLASTAEDESLLAFLGVRGDLPKETVRRLASRFAPFGRHAGAALVARGYLRQDQMWPTLRAHAEWLLVRVVQMQGGRLVVEPQPPGRLAGEPSVFGGSTGAGVFVEIVRRVFPPSEALERLGGPGSRVGEGPQGRLLDECALGPAELQQVRTMWGRALRDVLAPGTEADLATVVFALAQLGVVEVLAAVGDGAIEDEPQGPGGADIDADAIRERVRARMQLVDDGDYFSLLGVTRQATGYEVRRAFLELRRAFDPSRLLTPEIADLADDVRKITAVLEEAYDILKDAARRERYRRAIEGPAG